MITFSVSPHYIKSRYQDCCSSHCGKHPRRTCDNVYNQNKNHEYKIKEKPTSIQHSFQKILLIRNCGWLANWARFPVGTVSIILVLNCAYTSFMLKTRYIWVKSMQCYSWEQKCFHQDRLVTTISDDTTSIFKREAQTK